MVKAKDIFEFLETVFNITTKQIVCNNCFGRRIEFVGNEDVVAIVVVLLHLPRMTTNLMGTTQSLNRASDKYVLCETSLPSGNLYFTYLTLMPIMLFDEGNELI